MPRHWVLHVDLDEFVAAVEVLRRPDLAGKPVVVGGRGDPAERGVVSTASYAARAFGVHSGMPLRVAVRKCPEAVFLPVDADAYLEASEAVMNVLRDTGAEVEVIGWDEAFLGVDTDEPQDFADRIRRDVLAATGLHCSAGIGDNKLRAKIATGFGKPRGTFRLTHDNWFDVMADRPVGELWGIGSRTTKRLAALGISTVGQLAVTAEEPLATEFGPRLGPHYRALARGAGSAAVDASPYRPRSRSRETTFQQDVTDWSVLPQDVRRLAAQVAQDAREEGRPVVRVGLKVRYAPFETHTRSVLLARPVRPVHAVRPAGEGAPSLGGAAGGAEPLAEAALGLLSEFDHTRAVRLIGVRAELAPAGAERGLVPSGDGAPAWHD